MIEPAPKISQESVEKCDLQGRTDRWTDGQPDT